MCVTSRAEVSQVDRGVIETNAGSVDASAPRGTSEPSLLSRCAIGMLVFYRAGISPFLGSHCRFEPTCSRYGLVALQTHGLLRGLALIVRRLSRCHPFHAGGYDPVPSSWGRSSTKRQAACSCGLDEASTHERDAVETAGS